MSRQPKYTEIKNRIKTDASIEQIGKVYKFYKMLSKNKIFNK